MSDYFLVYCLNCDSIVSSIHLNDTETCPICKNKETIFPVHPAYFLIYFNKKTGQPIIMEI
jgi:hypothetical protein